MRPPDGSVSPIGRTLAMRKHQLANTKEQAAFVNVLEAGELAG